MKINIPEISTQRLAIKLKPAAEKAVKQGHPWVFESGIAKTSKAGQAGDLAIIFDQKKNKFLAIGLWDAHSPIRIKILHYGSSIKIDETFFLKKIEVAYQKRIALFENNTNSYRLLYGENDGFPGLIFDVYASVGVIKLYSAIWLPYLHLLLPILIEKANIETLVLRLNRQLQQTADWPQDLNDGSVLYGQLKEEEVPFLEHGIKFHANVIKGHKTGYFLDHRYNRHKIGQMAKGKAVLDVFSYAGGFSVHALVGGAKEVLSIDISAQALEVAKKNAALNLTNPPHQLWAIDAFEGMAKLKQQKKFFDIVVIDPPSFAKKGSEVPNALKTYRRLIKAAIPLVKKGGLLLSCSCSSRVKKDEFYELNEMVLKESGRPYQELEKTEHDIDHPISFPEGAYLKSVYYKL